MFASMYLFTALNGAKSMILCNLLLLKWHIFAMIILKWSVNGDIYPFVYVSEIQQVSLWGLNKEYFTNRYICLGGMM